VTLAAHAKLNLFLRVLAREESGFHSIETLLVRLALSDEVRIELSDTGGVQLSVTGHPELPTDSRNLCVRAAEALLQAAGREEGVRIELDKKIPVGAGLGGGSADAAMVLRGLQRLLAHPLSEGALYRLAGELGSDVPFGLCEAPMALAWERGRRLLPLAAPARWPVVVAVPGYPISAGDAYGWLADDRAAGLSEAPGPACLPAPRSLAEIETVARVAVNDLQTAVFRRHPDLEEIREDLRTRGARVALLCGSGSCVAGVFDSAAERDGAAAGLERREGLSVIVTSTVD
jgi:4-diphosphocytidyl-2-C-methyl-D-erythritol kinase